MTNVNRTYGNFAIKDNEAFMVMNRNYELQINGGPTPTSIRIGDLSTYIDPVKFNYIFADASPQLYTERKEGVIREFDVRSDKFDNLMELTTNYRDWETDRKSTRLNSSHRSLSRMPSSA